MIIHRLHSGWQLGDPQPIIRSTALVPLVGAASAIPLLRLLTGLNLEPICYAVDLEMANQNVVYGIAAWMPSTTSIGADHP